MKITTFLLFAAIAVFAEARPKRSNGRDFLEAINVKGVTKKVQKEMKAIQSEMKTVVDRIKATQDEMNTSQAEMKASQAQILSAVEEIKDHTSDQQPPLSPPLTVAPRRMASRDHCAGAPCDWIRNSKCINTLDSFRCECEYNLNTNARYTKGYSQVSKSMVCFPSSICTACDVNAVCTEVDDLARIKCKPEPCALNSPVCICKPGYFGADKTSTSYEGRTHKCTAVPQTNEYIELTKEFGTAYATNSYSEEYNAEKAFKIGAGENVYWRTDPIELPDLPVFLWFEFNNPITVFKVKFLVDKPKHQRGRVYEVFASNPSDESRYPQSRYNCGDQRRQTILCSGEANEFVNGKECGMTSLHTRSYYCYGIKVSKLNTNRGKITIKKLQFLFKDFDLCQSNPCVHGSCSMNTTDSYTCLCKPGYGGDNCDEALPEPTCGPNQFNCGDGTCIRKELYCDGEPDCRNDHDEINCGDIDDCQPNPCVHGSCTDTGVNSYTCKCDSGYRGDNCAEDVDACQSNPCGVGGWCTDAGLNSYTCECKYGYRGDNCDEEMNVCEYRNLRFSGWGCYVVRGWKSSCWRKCKYDYYHGCGQHRWCNIEYDKCTVGQYEEAPCFEKWWDDDRKACPKKWKKYYCDESVGVSYGCGTTCWRSCNSGESGCNSSGWCYVNGGGGYQKLCTYDRSCKIIVEYPCLPNDNEIEIPPGIGHP